MDDIKIYSKNGQFYFSKNGKLIPLPMSALSNPLFKKAAENIIDLDNKSFYDVENPDEKQRKKPVPMPTVPVNPNVVPMPTMPGDTVPIDTSKVYNGYALFKFGGKINYIDLFK